MPNLPKSETGAKMRFIKRFTELRQSGCLACGKFLCAMARVATYTGEIECYKCATVNVFMDSCFPVYRVANNECPRGEGN